MPPFMSPPQTHLNVSIKWQIFTNLGNDMMPPQGIPHTAWLNMKLTVASPTLPTSTWTSKKCHSVTCHNHPTSVIRRSMCCFNFLPPITPKCQPCEFLIWKHTNIVHMGHEIFCGKRSENMQFSFRFFSLKCKRTIYRLCKISISVFVE